MLFIERIYITSPSGDLFSRAFLRRLPKIYRSVITNQAHSQVCPVRVEKVLIYFSALASMCASRMRTVKDGIEWGEHFVSDT